ncbi:hypothetical protein DL96DRAFT_1501751 [Flagelloscypha sp. PMI_526]|nr:hypothetical protein DL96DRAFT_1501751 [Flagelloscypha sp. PMI_526]
MVALTTSLIFFASIFAVINALPTPYAVRSLQVRRPTVGQPVTLSKTTNNLDTGDFTTDGGDFTVTVGDKISGGSTGDVFKVDCGADADCQALGPMVLKFYTALGLVGAERQNLAKIGELKAVDKGDGDSLTLMKGFEGKKLSETDAYLALTAQVADKTQLDIPAITQLVQTAKDLVDANGREYLKDHGILHQDINDGNVLFTESGGSLTAAQLIDWDSAVLVPAEDFDQAAPEVTRQLDNFTRFVDAPQTEKTNADAAAGNA